MRLSIFGIILIGVLGSTVTLGTVKISLAGQTYLKVVNPFTGDEWLNFTSHRTHPGSTFVVNITVFDVTDLGCWQTLLTWNASLLDFVSASIPSDHVFSQVSLPSHVLIAGPIAGSGYVVLGARARWEQDPYWTFNGTGTLCQITLNVTQDVGEMPPTELGCELAFAGYESDTFLLDGSDNNIPFSPVKGFYSLKYAPGGDVDVAVTDIRLHQSIVGKGYCTNVSVTVENHGPEPDAINVTLYGDFEQRANLGYWKFDEGGGTTASDSSGYDNDGAIVGATWTGGKISNALQFDGVDDYVQVPDAASLNITGVISIEAWVNFDALPGEIAWFVSKDEGPGPNYKWCFGYAQNYAGISNALVFHINTPELISVWLESATFLPTIGQWYHIAVTKSNNDYTFYVDGTDRGLDSSTYPLPSINAPVEIGKAENELHFDGVLDEVKIYNRTLSADDVWAEYTREELGLVGYWKFDEGSGTTASDSSGNDNHGTLMNAPVWVNGICGKALNFDGTDDYVDVGNDPSLNPLNEMTIAAWIKPERFAGSGGWAGVIAARWNDGSEINAYVFETNCNSSLRLWIMGVGDVFGGSLQIGKWQHVAGTYDGNYIKLYIDGVEVGRTGASGFINSATQNTLIGSNRDNAGARFNGTIDEVRIYNRSLSADASTSKKFAIGTQTVTLESGASTTLTFTWNTTGFAKGSYNMSVYAWPVLGEIDMADNLRIDGIVSVGVPCDVTGPTPNVTDGQCNMRDIGFICKYFNARPGDPRWELPECRNCDVVGPLQGPPDGIVNMRDIGEACNNFGRTIP